MLSEISRPFDVCHCLPVHPSLISPLSFPLYMQQYWTISHSLKMFYSQHPLHNFWDPVWCENSGLFDQHVLNNFQTATGEIQTQRLLSLGHWAFLETVIPQSFGTCLGVSQRNQLTFFISFFSESVTRFVELLMQESPWAPPCLCSFSRKPLARPERARYYFSPGITYLRHPL